MIVENVVFKYGKLKIPKLGIGKNSSLKGKNGSVGAYRIIVLYKAYV